MPTIPLAPWEEDPIGYLVAERFPFLREPPSFGALWAAELVGDPRPIASSATRHDDGPPGFAAAEAYRDELSALPPAEIEALVTEARRRQEDPRRRELEEIERARSFNQPAAISPDYDNWAKHSYWTMDEVVALSLGREPSLIAWANIETMVLRSSFAKAYANRREIVRRATVAGQLGQATSPAAFLAWAERMRIGIPTRLKDAIVSIGDQVRDWKSVADELRRTVDQLQASLAERQREALVSMQDHSAFIKNMREGHNKLYDDLNGLLDTRKKEIVALVARIEEMKAERARPEVPGQRERESLLKLVLGMAIGGYGFQPRAGRSPTARTIADDLHKIGLSLDEDTVRKYLAEAKELLPGDRSRGD